MEAESAKLVVEGLTLEVKHKKICVYLYDIVQLQLLRMTYVKHLDALLWSRDTKFQ